VAIGAASWFRIQGKSIVWRGSGRPLASSYGDTLRRPTLYYRFFKFPDFSGTLGVLEADQTWTGANTFDQGSIGTATINFGHMGSSTSHVCFNTKNTDGQDVSFFIVGTSIVVEANVCQ
jgi:hypothetical protein